jgi:hypothetical protein
MNITVVLNGYKRARHFKTQLDAIKNQTIKPKEILLWQNYGEEFDKNLVSETTHASCNKNLGVWARFAFALNAKTEYICVFDDDTIPGTKWLENCYNTIQKHDGLLGTIGVNFLSKNSYQPIERFGWANPNENVVKVDIVGHAWFFRREWLSTFWRELPDVNQPTIVGEDIHFSYTLKKYLDKNTYVPPHPVNDVEMWGSKPNTAWTIGQDVAAISMNMNNLKIMSDTYVNYINKGFKK